MQVYSSICSRLDFLFETTRRKLCLPTRKFDYKLNREQYPKEIINMIHYILKYLLLLCMIFIIGYIFMLFVQGVSNVVNFILSIISH